MDATYRLAYRWLPPQVTLTMMLIAMTLIMAACHKSYDDWMNN